jgi:hypothetical protein
MTTAGLLYNVFAQDDGSNSPGVFTPEFHSSTDSLQHSDFLELTMRHLEDTKLDESEHFTVL